MLRKLGVMVLFVLCFAAWSVPVQSANLTSGHILGGSANSPVKLEVFSDFQCPACRELFLGTIRQVIKEYSGKDKVCVIYHEYPLNMHPYARIASRYVTAASRLGNQKLLPLFETLFVDQAQWAQDGNLDATISKAMTREDFQKIKRMAQDASINADIDKEVQLGVLKEVKSTPTMFITYPGKQQKVEGLVTYPVMKQFIDSIVK